jgi:hypothetical protein
LELALLAAIIDNGGVAPPVPSGTFIVTDAQDFIITDAADFIVTG